ncbi:MAG: carbohydrate-binding domain-containing protein, partial [Firmicutes bacterium]|nr:carbohydrate-binding domain-containing protein [Bacillota bacterium]
MKENMKKTIAALSAAAVMLAASASIYACSNGSLAGRFGAKDTSVPAASEQSEAQGSAAAGSSENAHGPFGNAPAGMKGGLAGAGQSTASYAESPSEIVLSGLTENSAETLTADYAKAETITMSDENSSVKISSAGIYIITGSCADGNITVKKGTTGVVLVLRDLDLTSSTGATLSLNKGSEVKIVIEGTVSLTDAEDIANEESDDFDGAAVKAKAGSSVVLTGSGTLNVNGSCKHGIKVSSLDEDDIADGYSEASFIVDGDLTINVSAAEDGMNSGTDLTIKSGTVNVSAGDDGIKADYILTIGVEGAEGPEINVKKSAEGLEGAVVNILSGDITVNASDDGINAANSDLTGYSFSINIMGGDVTVSSGADGLDSNGNINITGGLTTIAKSAMNGGEGGIDYEGSCYVADGCLVNPYGTTMDSGMGGR